VIVVVIVAVVVAVLVIVIVADKPIGPKRFDYRIIFQVITT
jgi:hypothetical protein